MDLQEHDKTMSFKTKEPAVADMPVSSWNGHDSHLKVRNMTSIIARGCLITGPLLHGCHSSGLEAVIKHTMM